MIGETNVRGGSDLPRHTATRRDSIDLAIAYGLILSVLWTPRPWQRILWIVAAAGVTAILILSRNRIEHWGFGWKGLLPSAWVVGLALIVSGCTFWLASRLHTLHVPSSHLRFWLSWWAYVVWAIAQQFLLQDLFLVRLERTMRNGRLAALAAAGLFAAAHLPNPILFAVTLFWGFPACLIFQRYRNLYALAVAHAILGITVAYTIPGPVSHNMRAGLSYLTYTPPRAPVSAQP